MTLKIVTAAERLAERVGAKILLVGEPGRGKTWQLRTLDAGSTLFIDIEAGGLSVRDVECAHLRPHDQDGNPRSWTWPELQDVAVLASGPDAAVAAGLPYSEQHYAEARERCGGLDPTQYETLFVDSITVAARLCLKHWQQRYGNDTRGAYGELGRDFLAWTTRLQHAREQNVVFAAIMEWVAPEDTPAHWSIQLDGGKAKRELPGIVDEVITVAEVVLPGEEAADRVFITAPGNPWGFPAKDRSGKLEPVMKPDLGEVIRRIVQPAAAAAA